MAEYLIQGETLTAIADAIRNKINSQETITPSLMADKILNINGGIQNISTETEMNSLLNSNNVGKVYKFVGETTNTYVKDDLYIVEEVEE